MSRRSWDGPEDSVKTIPFVVMVLGSSHRVLFLEASTMAKLAKAWRLSSRSLCRACLRGCFERPSVASATHTIPQDLESLVEHLNDGVYFIAQVGGTG